jgi:hypothetical protein
MGAAKPHSCIAAFPVCVGFPAKVMIIASPSVITGAR